VGVEIRALTWNLYHGRDAPPDPGLHTRLSRLLRRTERGEAHAQVNVDLFDQFAGVLADDDWDLALLQECPPRWAERLAVECRAQPHLVPTARNLPFLGRVQSVVASINPDLIASWEGGSNLTLVRTRRAHTNAIVERRSLTLATHPEVRRMAFSRLAAGVCVVNLHASTDRARAAEEVERSARIASRWAGASELVLGGDFNTSPDDSPELFETLEQELGLRGPTGPDAIDHLLLRGGRIVAAPLTWPAARREVPDPTDSGGEPLPIRLSDHAPVEATFELR
jgi:endonuclease/exonuclease/phosphatase family metal-dependent hydrolase